MGNKHIEERMRAAEAFLEIAKYLASRPPYAAPLGASATEIENIKDKHIWWRAVTCHMLYAIVFEIAIKMIWTLDNRMDCPYIHDIASLYDQLSDMSRQAIEGIYHDETTAFARIRDEIRARFDEDVQFQSLREALIANEDTMKNFKYSNKFEGKSSVLGSVIWVKATLWTLPSLDGARFPEALYRYAADRVEKAN